jgi:hypothetical protein
MNGQDGLLKLIDDAYELSHPVKFERVQCWTSD